MIRRAALLGLLGLMATAPLMGQTAPPRAQASAQGSITVLRPLTITTTAEMSFGRLQPQGNGPSGTVVLSSTPPTTRTSSTISLLSGGNETPLIRTISGVPGAVYRISYPSSAVTVQGGYPVTAFTLWSANSGTITNTRISQLNASGSDTIRIGATLTLPKGAKQNTFTVAVPVTIFYE